jgi:hypothetical protein
MICVSFDPMINLLFSDGRPLMGCHSRFLSPCHHQICKGQRISESIEGVTCYLLALHVFLIFLGHDDVIIIELTNNHKAIIQSVWAVKQMSSVKDLGCQGRIQRAD